jgi:hypothetical protein
LMLSLCALVFFLAYLNIGFSNPGLASKAI